MEKYRIIAMIGILVLAITSLTGCSISVTGDNVPSKREVMNYVEGLCPNEDVEYTVSTRRGGYYNKKQVVYHYTSNERDLEFDVIATVDRAGYEIFYWNPVILQSYNREIFNYYREGIEDVFVKYDDVFDIKKHVERPEYFSTEPARDAHNNLQLLVDSYDDVLQAVEVCYELNMVYSEEAKYNTLEWRNDNPLFTVSVICTNITDNYNLRHNIIINGEVDHDAVYDELTEFYIQNVYDGKLEDDTEFDMSGRHKGQLQVTVNGKSVDRDDINGGTSVNAWKTEDFVAKYDYKSGAYYLPLNLKINKNRAPMLLQYYTECAEGKINNYDKDTTEFSIGSDNYKIELDLGRINGNEVIEDFTFRRGGNKITVRTLEKSYEWEYIFWVHVDDMAEIFDFEYVIDEDNETIDMIW